MGGKNKKTKIGNHYRIALHLGLTRGSIDAYLELRVADKTAWQGSLTSSGKITVSAPDLFGGEKDQGGVEGTAHIMFGEPTQVPSEYLQAVFGNQTAAWRGFTTFVWEGGRWGAMNPFAQKPSHLIRKIINGWDGDWGSEPCWYPAKAEVSTGAEEPVELFGVDAEWKYRQEPPSSTADYSDPLYDDSGWATGQGGFGNHAPGWDTPPARTLIPYTAYGHVWIRRQFGPIPAGHDLIIEVWHDNIGAAWINGAQVPLTVVGPYRSIARIPAAGLAGVNVAAVRVTDDGPGYIYAAMSLSYQRRGVVGMNPAHALVYVRTDSDKGREHIESIDDAQLRAAADKLHAEGFGLCWEYDPERDTPDSWTAHVCDIIGGAFERSLRDGKWRLHLVRDDYDFESLPIISDSAGVILSYREVPSALHGAVNTVGVRYFDIARAETVTIWARAPGLIRHFGEVRQVFDYPEIPEGALAARVAERKLRDFITPKRSFEIHTDPSFRSIDRFETVRLQVPKRGIADIVCIVGERDVGTLRSGAIRWVLTEHVYGFADAQLVEVELGIDTGPPAAALPIANRLVFEAPYIDVAATLPRAELDALPDDVGYLVGVAADPGQHLEFSMHAQPAGGEYAQVATGDWAPTAVIVEAATADPTETEFTLADGAGLSDVTVGSVGIWGREWCRVDVLDLESDPVAIKLGRACADSVPTPHAAGERIWFPGAGVAADPTEYTDGEAVDVKLLSRTGSERLPLALAPPDTVAITGRQARPYPPAAVTINGQWPYTGGADADLELAWSYRDRILQADQLVDWTEGDVGPEPGTTFVVRVVDTDAAAEIYREDGITGNTHTVPQSSLAVNNRLEIFSVRDGLESWQRVAVEINASFLIVSALPRMIAAGVPYEHELAPNDAGVAPFAWSLLSGALPTGWALDPDTGKLGGTATAAGDYHFAIECEDGGGAKAVKHYTIKVAEVAAALLFEGTDGSTTFTDLTGKSWSAAGSPSIDTDDADFPAGALYMPAATSSSALQVSHADFAFGTGDYTMEAYAKIITATRNRTLFGWGRTGGSYWTFYAASAQRWYVFSPVVGNNVVTGESVEVGVRNHWRHSRANGRMQLFKNLAPGSGPVLNRTNFTDSDFSIGGDLAAMAFGNQWSGHISRAVVIKGVGLRTLPLSPLEDFPVLVAGEVNRSKTYWRILITDNDSVDNAAAAAAIEFLDSPGGTNLATGGTAAASSYILFGDPVNAFDGSDSTRWKSAVDDVPTCTVQYQLPQRAAVNSVAIRAATGTNAELEAPREFIVQSSEDGEIWFDEWSVSVASAWALGERREFPRP